MKATELLSLVNAVKKRLWLSQLTRFFSYGLICSAVIVFISGLTHRFYTPVSSLTILLFTLILITATIIYAAVYRRPNTSEATQTADRLFSTNALLDSAIEQLEKTSSSSSAASRFVIQMANQIATDSHSKLAGRIPIKIPSGSTILMSTLGVGGIFLLMSPGAPVAPSQLVVNKTETANLSHLDRNTVSPIELPQQKALERQNQLNANDQKQAEAQLRAIEDSNNSESGERIEVANLHDHHTLRQNNSDTPSAGNAPGKQKSEIFNNQLSSKPLPDLMVKQLEIELRGDNLTHSGKIQLKEPNPLIPDGPYNTTLSGEMETVILPHKPVLSPTEQQYISKYFKQLEQLRQ